MLFTLLKKVNMIFFMSNLNEFLKNVSYMPEIKLKTRVQSFEIFYVKKFRF